MTIITDEWMYQYEHRFLINALKFKARAEAVFLVYGFLTSAFLIGVVSGYILTGIYT